MKVAFVIFDGMTALDFIGVYDPVTRLKTMGFMPEFDWDICAHSQPVRDIAGLIFTPTRVDEFLAEYDTTIVPGEFGTRALVNDAAFIGWLKTGWILTAPNTSKSARILIYCRASASSPRRDIHRVTSPSSLKPERGE
jgi:hypothetical protein